jgi:hypothetical protein
MSADLIQNQHVMRFTASNGDQIWGYPDGYGKPINEREGSDGQICFSGINYHCADGPAVIRANGTLEWWHHGRRHRVGFPAVIHANDGREEWWIDGVQDHYQEDVSWWNEVLNRQDE